MMRYSCQTKPKFSFSSLLSLVDTRSFGSFESFRKTQKKKYSNSESLSLGLSKPPLTPKGPSASQALIGE